MTRTIHTVLLGVVLSALGARTGWASEGPPPILNPKTYSSPTGDYSLLVDPTDLHGRGAGDYRFAKNGDVLWSKRLPFTLWEAEVAPNGMVAGYAYTHGWRGFAEKGIGAGYGDFVVVLLSAQGEIVNQETYPREGSEFLDTPPDPLARGIILDQYNKRFLVRVHDPDLNRGIEQWWVFDLATGRRTGTLEPVTLMPREEDASLFVLDARALPGTPLILTHWWKCVYPQCGAVFTLVDPQAKPVWSLSLDDDYTVPDDEEAEDRLHEMIRSKGAILAVEESPSFSIHLVKERKRASFSVTKGADGSWQVQETARTPWEPSEPVQETVEYRQLNAEKIGVVELAGTPAATQSGIEHVNGFAFDSKGRICALLAYGGKPPRVVLVSQQGEILQEIALPVEKVPEGADFAGPAHVGGSRFVVSMSKWDIGALAECFLADFDTVSIKRLPDVDCPTIKAMAGFEDGRFAALTNRREKYTSTPGLFFFDARGQCLWKKEEDEGYSDKPEELLSPEDIMRYGADTIAVLDNIAHTVQFFDARGGYLRTIEMEKTWGRGQCYPTDIAEDADGGLLVYDFNAEKPLVRMDAEGRIRNESVARFADGHRFRIVDGVKRSPEGELWTSDGNALLRLAADGIVGQVLGEKPVPDRLTQPDRSFVDVNDRIYVADRRTKAVHVFDATGKKLGVCVPDAKDLSETSSVDRIAVSPAGEVFVSLSAVGDPSYVRFGSDLSRKGTVHVDVDSVCQDWYFQPSGDLCWIQAYNDVFLIKDLRETVCKVSRRADRRWLERPWGLAVAPAGSIAVVAHSQSEASVSTYGPTGDVRTTFAVPKEWFVYDLAYDGQCVFIRQDMDVFVVDSTGRNLGRFSLGSDAPDNDWSGPHLAARGKELWFLDRKRMAVHKYAVPTAAGP